MDGVFSGCKAFDQPLSLWDVSKVTTMNGMFKGCETFNQPLDSWNVHSVKEMKGLFNGCKTFNQPLDKWYMRRVTKMSGMFEDCQKFNQPLNSWEVYEVTDMEGMFLNCQSFNQPLNEWDVSEVVNMKKIFQGCTSFNQDLGAWKLEKCTHIGLGKSGIDIENFSKTLEKWANESYLESVTLEASYLQYAWQAPVATLRTKGWTINGCTHDPRYIRVRITPSDLSLAVSHLSTLRADIFASDGLNQEVIWLSDTPTIAAVNKVTGEVTALAPGTATITATSTDDPSQRATCQVTVRGIRSVTIIPSSFSLTVGATQTLNATVTAIGGVEETVKWSSSAPTIASIDEGSGVITALALGTATITATSTAAPSQHATCQVTVGRIRSVTIIPSSLSLTVGATQTLNATVSAVGGVEETVKWNSSAPTIAAVDEGSGVVTALTLGTATITATSTADPSQHATCQVTVGGGIERVFVLPSTVALALRERLTLSALVRKVGSVPNTVTWASNDPKVVTVDPTTGEITAVAVGKTMVTATSTSDPSKIGACAVIVKGVREISVSPLSLDLLVGERSEELFASVDVFGDVDEQVTWTSAHPAIARIDPATGVVVGVATGRTTLTATSVADPNKSATCQVTVGAVQKVTVTPAEASMLEGMTLALSAQVKVFGNVPQSVFWVSSNENVALVDEASGEVTALAPGRVLIVAVSTADLTQRGACTLRVTPITPPVEIVPVTRITVSPENAKLKVGERRFFTARVFPATATEKGYSWRSDNPAVAEVSETGEVVAKAVGTCQLIAHTTEAGSSVEGVCQLTILPAVTPVARLIVSPSVKTLKVNEAVRLRVRVIPSNATEKGYTWRSDNPAVAEVSETGEVVARSVGTCQLIAHTSEAGSSVEGVCHLTVIAAETPVVKVSAITLAASQPSLTVGERVLFSAMVLPTTATEKGVTWHSSNETVAEVSPSGEVTGKGVGTCRIIAHTTEQGSSIEGVCQISVRPRRVPVERLVVTPQATTLSVAEKLTLKAMVLPRSATEKGVTWHSSDETVATVDATGNVTAKALGTCQLIAQSNEAGSAVEGVCHLTVSASVVKVSTITLVAPHSSLEVDERMTLTATIVPDNASEKGVTWHTSDEAVASIDATGEVTGKAAGTCTLTATTKEVGSAVKGTWELTVVAKGNAVEDAALASLTIAPNPFTSQLRIVNPTGSKAGYELVDAAGVVVRSGVLHTTEEFIDTTLLPTGLYFVRLMGQKGAERRVMVFHY